MRRRRHVRVPNRHQRRYFVELNVCVCLTHRYDINIDPINFCSGQFGCSDRDDPRTGSRIQNGLAGYVQGFEQAQRNLGGRVGARTKRHAGIQQDDDIIFRGFVLLPGRPDHDSSSHPHRLVGGLPGVCPIFFVTRLDNDLARAPQPAEIQIPLRIESSEAASNISAGMNVRMRNGRVISTWTLSPSRSWVNGSSMTTPSL